MDTIRLSTPDDSVALAAIWRASVRATHDFLSDSDFREIVQAVGFYRHMGFTVTGRSPTDEAGRPYPLLHMRQE